MSRVDPAVQLDDARLVPADGPLRLAERIARFSPPEMASETTSDRVAHAPGYLITDAMPLDAFLAVTPPNARDVVTAPPAEDGHVTSSQLAALIQEQRALVEAIARVTVVQQAHARHDAAFHDAAPNNEMHDGEVGEPAPLLPILEPQVLMPPVFVPQVSIPAVFVPQVRAFTAEPPLTMSMYQTLTVTLPEQEQVQERPPMIIERAQAELLAGSMVTLSAALPRRLSPLPGLFSGFALSLLIGAALYVWR